MLTIKGTGRKSGDGPLSQKEALEYFSDVPAFLQKIEDVDKVKALGHPNSYLVTHKPIGAFNFYTVVVYAVQVEMTETGMLLKPLDFDETKIKSEHMVIKGFCEGELKSWVMEPQRTGVDFVFHLTLELPIPPALKLIPTSLIQTTADGIMNFKVGLTIDAFYKKVMEDLNLPA